MARERKDRSANWILEHHGGSLLRLAKITNFTAWQASHTVLSFPKKMPDGILDVTFPGRPAPDPFLIEIESYPLLDTLTQIRDDAAMVLLSRGVLPDILLVILRPKGNQDIDAEQRISSAHGCTELSLRIRVIKLWTLSAEDLLAANDVGLIPWIPLTHYAGAPEALLQQCKERIEQQAPADEKGNLLAATRVMAEMRYNDPQLLGLFTGGSVVSLQKIFAESPSVQWYGALVAREKSRAYVLDILEKRFASVPDDLAAYLRSIESQDRLDHLHAVAIDCADLEAFRTAMSQPE